MSQNFASLQDTSAAGKRVLVRADFNVPLRDGEVVDDSRIQACLPTLEKLLSERCRIVICSHLGRPKGRPEDGLKMDPVAHRLADLLGHEVKKLDDCVGDEVLEQVEQMKPGDVVLLENTRFHPEEKENDPGFAEALAELGELFVNDAFATAHRAHASSEGVAHHLPAVAGFLMQHEVETLSRLREQPEHPFVAILGGAKVADKISVIRNLLSQVDHFLIGGVLASTFLQAAGTPVGASKVDAECFDLARKLLSDAGNRLIIPTDVIIAERLQAGANHRQAAVTEIPQDWSIADIGPRSIEVFCEHLRPARTIVWNGPLGFAEVDEFAGGTREIARQLAGLSAQTVIGGGDTAAAVEAAGVKDRMSHVSTGGGAFLKFLAGDTLPGLEALAERRAA